ncbi:MAG: response regulator transcription factor [Acutalibacter sp.]
MLRILIADDEQKIRQGLRNIVDWESLGYEIAGEAADGGEAVSFMAKENPDVVLLDISMPKYTGLEVIQRAREQGFCGKVIILSGYSDFKYAQEAIRLGVEYYLTKPIDEEELEQVLLKLQREIQEEARKKAAASNYYQRARETILRDLFLDPTSVALMDLVDMSTASVPYQVVLYEKYVAQQEEGSGFSFERFLRVNNQEHHLFDQVTLDHVQAILLKGEGVIQRFNTLISQYWEQSSNSLPTALDAVFMTYGRPVSVLAEIHLSYEDAKLLLSRKFFSEQKQHVVGYQQLPKGDVFPAPLDGALLEEYCGLFLRYLQSFNRNMLAEKLYELEGRLSNVRYDQKEILYFLTDLYLQIKSQILRLYNNITILFPSNSWVMDYIQSRRYLYEIIQFFSEQFELIMSCIGHYSKDSILDDILHYIDHNYVNPLKLENIAPLFGYNCSYLGKLFKQKTGKSFNTYLDQLRIQHSKELLQRGDLKIYEVAEKVGYSNVDYFSTKFKKYEGISPAEYRKQFREG